MERVVQRRRFTINGLAVMAAGWVDSYAHGAVSQVDAVAGARLVLERGANTAVDLLGRADGFLGNQEVRIPLPAVLNDAAKLLKATGQQRRVDELVTSSAAAERGLQRRCCRATYQPARRSSQGLVGGTAPWPCAASASSSSGAPPAR